MTQHTRNHRAVVYGLIGVGVALIVVGLILLPNTPDTTTSTADSITITATPEAVVVPERVEPTSISTAVMQPTATSMPTGVGAIPLNTTILWQDSFENQASGWEPRYEVRQANYGYVDAVPIKDTRLFAWNGYDRGGYHFYLPGMPNLRGETATVLWDFHPTYQLPAYPYRVRADISVNPAGNALLLLDYVGDFGAMAQGDGLAVVWGQNDGLSYKYVDVWQLTVYEFHRGQTWELGCTSDELGTITGSTSSAVVDVDAQALAVTIYGEQGVSYSATCARVQLGQRDGVRFLGIGSVYVRPVVPGNDYNTVTFNDVYVMSGTSVAMNGAGYQEITGRCVPAWMGYWDDERAIDIVTVIDSETDCRNGYASFSSDFPGYGPERMAMPNADMLMGNWACGGSAPTNRLQFWQGRDTVMVNIDGAPYYVFYAKGIEGHLRGYSLDDVPTEGYIVTARASGGNNQTYQDVEYVQIGDGIGARDQHHFYFTLEGDQIITNWAAQPCIRE